ncbi:DNA topoisomerase 2-binding protein 1-B isoform X3 [Orussus abietinus]|uniref:DNA topoisomerase 2-binding protein 1-B isoform X3 n=1 Tax=Orussus abietinus TaxID=222816 RepID=UPI0006254C5B|nr:DNA topoisomerase 2-binding protein 1-B isoform X3 [Orussus abietinus]
MELQEDTETQFDVNIYFVIRGEYENETECSEDMWEAFNKCNEFDLSPKWITEKKCNKIPLQKKDVVVFEEFAGILFKKLQNLKCSIVGPRCLLNCFASNEPIPEGTNPVFVNAMRGLIICASGFSVDIKNRIQERVEYMGGIFTRQFRCSVTHLVTDSVMSAKYEKAVEYQLPIFTVEWVHAVWEANMKEFVSANNSVFDKYKCPVFKNLIVTSTALLKNKKEEIKHLINSNGGEFMGALDGSKVRIVLAPEKCPPSDKLKYAMQNNIACLQMEWVYESVSIGYALPFTKYLITSTKACSTPERTGAHETLNFSSISAISISGDLNPNRVVDETMMTTMRSMSSHTEVVQQDQTSYIPVLERLNLKEAKLAGPFLDGCNIYLAGFTAIAREKLNRILNVGSATRLDDLADAVTHVLIGDINKASAEIKLMRSKGLSPYVLHLDWLEESMKLKRPAAEENYLCEPKDDTSSKPKEPASPLSKKNLQMLQRPKKTIPLNIDRDTSSSKQIEQLDLTQQYLQKSVAPDKTLKEFLQPHTSTLEKNAKSINMSRTDSASLDNQKYNDSAIPISQGSNLNRIFEGLTFVLAGFNKEESKQLEETIINLAGQVINKSYSGIPDFGVVPLRGALLRHTTNDIVTNLFIDDCIDQDQLVDIMYYHRPVCISENAKPLTGCVITISSYIGKERLFLTELAQLLGAAYQDTFARKVNVERNIMRSTHLVCPTPNGNKYNAAVKWKLPAVTADWLQICALEQKLIEETPFLVGETMAPERSKEVIENTSKLQSTFENNQMKPPAVPLPRQVLTPKRLQANTPQVSQESAPGETPLINKRLKLLSNKTPQSPFHVSTPETPYGQIFKPSPSPSTRKELIKWADNFSDLRVEEPPLKKRAPSTPLSDLKRQLWEKIKQPYDQDDDQEDKSSANRNTAAIATSKTDGEEDSKSPASTNDTPINRRLSFPEDSSPVQRSKLNFHVAKLDEVLRETAYSSETRCSISGGKDAVPIDNVVKCMAKDSQFDTVRWEDGDQRQVSKPPPIDEENIEGETIHEEPEVKSIKPKFMLSGIKDRKQYEDVIETLGGEVSTEMNFDSTASHLLCMKPSRNEKMLGSIASGKWVLHCIYLQHCEREGKFLDEEKYEWGNPKSKGVIPDLSTETEKSIAAAAHRWRLKLMKEPEGAFKQMVALLLVQKEKYDQFKRLICAGSGTVVQARPPYDTSPGKKITHCFVQLRQVDQPMDWAMLASKGILCFVPQYLSDYLTAEQPLSPRDCVLPEFKKYLSLLPK